MSRNWWSSAGQSRLAAILQAFAVDVQLAPPLAVVVALPAEVQAGAEVEAGVGGHLQLERPRCAVLQGHGDRTSEQPPVGRSVGEVGTDVGHPFDPPVLVLDGAGHLR